MVKIFGRDDLLPAAGLAVAFVVVFSTPVAHVLETVRSVEDARGLQLLPALVILTFVFMAHQIWKRLESRARTLASDASAREATERAEDMGRLVAFGHGLAHSLEPEAIRRVAVEQLPQLMPGHRIWFNPGHDELSSAVGDEGRGSAPATHAVLCTPAEMRELVSRGDVCFPMNVADDTLGMMGVSSEPPLTAHQRSMLAAAAALLAVSLKNAALIDRVRQNSMRDTLTGCSNRGHALEVIDSELRRARRSRVPISLVMFDLDHFKQINDTQGHLCGDAVLASVGERMRVVLRGGDLKCRYGGEEFLVLLVGTPEAGALRVAELLRKQLAVHPTIWHDDVIAVTASFGVATATPDESDPLALVARADEALYRAKQQGRNRVCLGTPSLHDSAAADQPYQEQHDGDDQQNPDEVPECVAADHP